jgi:hypothetical protein
MIWFQMVEALKRFDEQPAGRRIVLLMSDDQAISEAQRRGFAIFYFYEPSERLTSVSQLAVNYRQGSLNRVAEETGGEAIFSGTRFVTFDLYFRELNDLLNRQWLITYRSANSGTGFRQIEATNRFRSSFASSIGLSRAKRGSVERNKLQSDQKYPSYKCVSAQM